MPLERQNSAGAAFLSAQGFADSGAAQPYFASAEVGTLWRLPVDESGDPAP